MNVGGPFLWSKFHLQRWIRWKKLPYVWPIEKYTVVIPFIKISWDLFSRNWNLWNRMTPDVDFSDIPWKSDPPAISHLGNPRPCPTQAGEFPGAQDGKASLFGDPAMPESVRVSGSRKWSSLFWWLISYKNHLITIVSLQISLSNPIFSGKPGAMGWPLGTCRPVEIAVKSARVSSTAWFLRLQKTTIYTF